MKRDHGRATRNVAAHTTRGRRAAPTLGDSGKRNDPRMDSFHESVRAGMIRARDAMNSGFWREAISELDQVIRAARAERAGYAEALWALAVCRDALGDARSAMDALD